MVALVTDRGQLIEINFEEMRVFGDVSLSKRRCSGREMHAIRGTQELGPRLRKMSYSA